MEYVMAIVMSSCAPCTCNDK